MKAKIAFFGSSFISAEMLEELMKVGVEIAAVVTKPDVLVGRKQEKSQNIVKKVADKYAIPCIDEHKHAIPFLQDHKIDLAIVASYGKILKQELLDVAPYGFLNFHPSLLPHLRGAIPMQKALFDGLRETGVTIIKMNSGMDTGEILAQKALPIALDDTFGSLAHKLDILGAHLINGILDPYLEGTLKQIKQDDTQATYCYVKDIESIKQTSWKDPAMHLDRAIRSLAPFERIQVELKGTLCNIIESAFVPAYATQNLGIPGEVVSIKDSGKRHIYLQCSPGVIELSSVQPLGRQVMQSSDFWNGYIRRI